LQLVQTVPADLASEVPTDVVVTAEFDAALNAASLSTSSFRVRREGGADVEGSVSVTGPTASYTPARALGLLSAYTAMLTTAIEGLSGQTLEVSHTWGFSTRDGQWGEPVLIEIRNASSADSPQVAVDPNGNAVAVWNQSDGTRLNIWANRFTVATGWGVAELIENEDAASASAPQVAVDPNGNAVAVWNQSDEARPSIWANRFTPAAGWSLAELIETDNAGGAANPQVAVDPNGNAVAVWNQSDGMRDNIWANRFTVAAGWSLAELIETDNAGGAANPQVAVDPNGNALAVWNQSDGMRFNIWANRFTPTGGWDAAEPIETDDLGNAFSPQVAVDPNGNALAVWNQGDGTRINVWANRFTPTGGWGTAELIETDNAGNAIAPQVAVDPNGNALAVWNQSDGTRISIWANRFTVVAGWGVAEPIENDDAGDASSPQVAADPNGNAVAVWFQSDGTRENVWANRFTSTTGWGAAELIEHEMGPAISPEVAVDPNGNAVAVWFQSDGTRFNILANRFE
jgi:uncharacterized membrane-anchored protein